MKRSIDNWTDDPPKWPDPNMDSMMSIVMAVMAVIMLLAMWS